MKLENKVALITGGARGIGAASAKVLAKEGAHIVLVDLLDCEPTKKEINKINPNSEVLIFNIDIKNREQVTSTVNTTVKSLGSIDILVNSAGTASRLSLEDMDEETWERDIDTNLKGTFFFIQAAIYPHMKKQGSGRIINVSSISGIMGGPISNGSNDGIGRSGPAYASSKAGVIGLTKWVAKEVGNLGICCNSIAPGPIETEMTKGIEYKLDQPIQRLGLPEEVAEAVLFLSSPNSGYVTGQVIKVCGGAAIG